MKLLHRNAIVALSVIGLAACSDDGISAPDQNVDLVGLNADVALVVADATLEDLRDMIFLGGSPFGAQGMSFSRTVSFFGEDVGDGPVPQDFFDPLLTASVNVFTEMTRDVARENWTATVARSRDMTVSGLLGEEMSRFWNGTASADISQSHNSDEFGDRSRDMTMDAVITAVERGLPRAENPWPLSGTIARTVTVMITNGPNGDVTITRTALVTFNGTQFVVLVVNGDVEFTVDLGARDGRNPVRRRDRNSDG